MAIKEFIWNLIPDFNTIPGFIFYTLIVYGLVLLMSWFTSPILDEEYKE